jgi:hypothetical protein
MHLTQLYYYSLLFAMDMFSMSIRLRVLLHVSDAHLVIGGAEAEMYRNGLWAPVQVISLFKIKQSSLPHTVVGTDKLLTALPLINL